MERRNTIQREIVLKAVRQIGKHAAADEIYRLINQDYPSIGKGTVYRNLNVLAEEGLIRKVEIPDGPDRFDRTVADHCHILCMKCGKVDDIDVADFRPLTEQILNTRGFSVLGYDLLFRGICPECLTSEANEPCHPESGVIEE